MKFVDFYLIFFWEVEIFFTNGISFECDSEMIISLSDLFAFLYECGCQQFFIYRIQWIKNRKSFSIYEGKL